MEQSGAAWLGGVCIANTDTDMSFALLTHVRARQSCMIIGRQHRLWCFRGMIACAVSWHVQVECGTC